MVLIGYDLITTSEQEKATSQKTYRDDCSWEISILSGRYERSQENARSQRLESTLTRTGVQGREMHQWPKWPESNRQTEEYRSATVVEK